MIVRREHLPAGSESQLAVRLTSFLNYLRPLYRHGHQSYNAQGMYDLELAVQILNLPEWAEWLRVHGDDDQQRFAIEVLENIETLDAFGDALGHGRGGPSGKDPVKEVEELVDTERAHETLAKAIKDASGSEFDDSTQGRVDAVKTLAAEAQEAARLREVLVETGALDATDVTTDTAALLRALLS